MASLNKVILIGNVGSDPEMRYTPSGIPVTSFRMATNRRYTTSGGETREETDWFRVSVWGKQAEVCNQFVTKGRQVYVEGRVRAQAWEGKDGQAHASLEVTANRVFLLGKPPAAAALPEEGEIEAENLPWEEPPEKSPGA